jgi:DNA-binding transcriptional MerR regulator
MRPVAMNETQTITELARDFGVTTRAIRYWESHGLVSPAREGGNRIYSKRDQTRLKLALRGKRLGLSLAEIKELIDMYDTVEDESTQLLSFLDVLAQRRAALEQQRDDIQAVLKEIARFETAVPRDAEGRETRGAKRSPTQTPFDRRRVGVVDVDVNVNYHACHPPEETCPIPYVPPTGTLNRAIPTGRRRCAAASPARGRWA